MRYILRLRNPEDNTVESIYLDQSKVVAVMNLANEKKIWHNVEKNTFHNLAYFIDCKPEPVKVEYPALPEVKITPEQRKKNIQLLREMKEKFFGKNNVNIKARKE